MAGNFPFNLERPQSLVIQFLGRLFGFDVFGIQSNLAAFPNLLWYLRSSAIGRGLVLRLGDGNLSLAILMELGERFSKIVGGWISNSDIQHQGSSRVVSIIGEEG